MVRNLTATERDILNSALARSVTIIADPGQMRQLIALLSESIACAVDALEDNCVDDALAYLKTAEAALQKTK